MIKNISDYHQFFSIKQNKKINHILILKDGRLSSAGENKGIYIYNKEYQPEMIIYMPNKHELTRVEYYIQSKNTNIIACFALFIQIVKLEPNNQYSLIQTLENHNSTTLKVIELQNNELISCSIDNCVIIWKINENNGKYEKINEIYGKFGGYDILDILTVKNEKELVISSLNFESLNFYNIQNNYEIITEIYNIQHCGFSMIEYNDLLLIGGKEKNGIYILDLNNYQLLGNYFKNEFGVYKIFILSNENILLISNNLLECSLKNNEIKIVSKKNAINHSSNSFSITSIIETKDKIIIISCSDGQINFWK